MVFHLFFNFQNGFISEPFATDIPMNSRRNERESVSYILSHSSMSKLEGKSSVLDEQRNVLADVTHKFVTSSVAEQDAENNTQNNLDQTRKKLHGLGTEGKNLPWEYSSHKVGKDRQTNAAASRLRRMR